jgi:hypothetical protein
MTRVPLSTANPLYEFYEPRSAIHWISPEYAGYRTDAVSEAGGGNEWLRGALQAAGGTNIQEE